MKHPRRFYPDYMESLAIGLLLFPIAGGMLASYAGYFMKDNWPGDSGSAAETAMLVSYIISFLPTVAYIAFREANSKTAIHKEDDWNYFSITRRCGNTCKAMAVLPCIAAGISLSFILSYISTPLPENENLERMLGMVRDGGPVMFAATTAVPAILEELLCRGTIMKSLLRYGRTSYAILFSAFIFAVMHMNPTQGIPAFTAGCIIGWIYFRTGSIFMAILVHFMNNATSFAVTKTELFPHMYDISCTCCSNSILLLIFMVFALSISCIAVHTITKTTLNRK